jgi:hypothetical protein
MKVFRYFLESINACKKIQSNFRTKKKHIVNWSVTVSLRLFSGVYVRKYIIILIKTIYLILKNNIILIMLMKLKKKDRKNRNVMKVLRYFMERMWKKIRLYYHNVIKPRKEKLKINSSSDNI